ncbi:MAG: diguanylate cyclase [Myxococcota bacterium]
MSDARIKVLLVEDNPADARLVQEYLDQCRPESYDMHCASRLATAVECLRGEKFDVLLLDLSLPDSGGLETVTVAQAAAPGLPIVVMTGTEDEGLAQGALQSGAQDYLVKGAATPSVIQRSIRYAISRAQTLRALQASEERYALAAKATQDGLWDWSLEDGTIYFSPRWKEMLGLEDAEIGDDPGAWFGLIHADEVDRVRAELDAHIQGRTSHFESEHRMRHWDGSYRWVLTRGLAVRNGDGGATRIAGSQSDITARKEAVESLRHNAFHDQLTGVANRALFLDRLEHALVRRRGGEPALVAIMSLGLDRFKVINESLGHAVGDKVLRQAAARLQRCLRAEDTLARTGGDRFMVLVEDVADIRDSLAVAARLQEALLEPSVFDGQEVFTSASVGITYSVTGDHRPEEYVRNAEIAMHRAKSAGGSRRQLFDRGCTSVPLPDCRLSRKCDTASTAKSSKCTTSR